jgi:hypothetical protein
MGTLYRDARVAECVANYHILDKMYQCVAAARTLWVQGHNNRPRLAGWMAARAASASCGRVMWRCSSTRWRSTRRRYACTRGLRLACGSLLLLLLLLSPCVADARLCAYTRGCVGADRKRPTASPCCRCGGGGAHGGESHP